MTARTSDPAIVILAGGRATRFPGKLERSFDGEPMLLRVFHNARATGWPVYVAGSRAFDPATAAAIDAPILPDRWPQAGPLRAFLSACTAIDHARVFALAADEPRVDRELLETLADAWQPGDETIVPTHGGRIEPLAALYARTAFLREARASIQRGNESLHGVIERINARFVAVSESYFVNVNTPEDLRRAARIQH
jgi:molybdopterin-guanine dinucleotide biosynthesis protein A